MTENDEITVLFRRRLEGAEMNVRDDFWEELHHDLLKAQAASGKRTAPFSPAFRRMAAAASVVFVLGAASAAFWYFSPEDEIGQAFTEATPLKPEGSPDGDIVVQETFPPIRQMTSENQNPATSQHASRMPAAEDEDGKVSVRVSVTITQRLYGNRQPSGGAHYAHAGDLEQYEPLPENVSGQNAGSSVAVSEGGKDKVEHTPSSVRNWALKASLGTSLPEGDFMTPLAAGMTVERKLNRYLSLETGLQYSYLPAGKSAGCDLHALSLPLRLNVSLAAFPKAGLYAIAGGTVEKTVNKSFSEDPVRLSVMAGLGIYYKLSERLSVFAEPLLSHHFATDTEVRSLRTERATNMNLLCGVRMAY